MTDFARAKARLTSDVLGVCQRHLPGGKVKGDWWLVSTPWRVDKNPSLVVNLKSGKWKDMARIEDHGDLIDLVARTTGMTAIEVVKEICGE